MRFLHSEENSTAIKQLFRSGGAIKCAVSFWGGDAASYLVGDGGRVKIICNLESGATNPHLVESLISRGVKIKSNPKLHAKVYIAEKEFAIVGSSNASANGLSFEDEELTGWIEASMLVDSTDALTDIDDWFAQQWEISKKVSNSMINEAKKKWSTRRNRRELKKHANTFSILDALKNDPNRFKDKNIYLSIYRDKTASEEAKEVFEQAKKQLRIENKLAFWEDWPELPEDSSFISIYYGPRGGFDFDGYFYIPQDKSSYIEHFESEAGESGEILICFLTNSIEGFSIDEKDQDLLRQYVDSLWKSANPQSKRGAVYLPLFEARNILFSK
jgi:hypothetical protein